ncbi:DEAD/DEAH box helicase [Kribbella sp. NBC_00382]
MTLPVSGSEPTAPPSSAFTTLHPKIQQWIWTQNWSELRSAQEQAVGPILAGDTDVIISAATASGKTEAAFLPICSALLAARDRQIEANTRDGLDTAGQIPGSGIQTLYISPLKALINDQYGRLDALCEHLDLPVHRWHGDVAGSSKARVLSNPDGFLLITPESLEALLVVHGPKISRLFDGLRHVVIDEMHSFIGTERGAQLQSLLHRIELAVRRRVARIGLSATLGDMELASEFLRPGRAAAVTVITAADDTHELRLQVRGYEAIPARLSAAESVVVERPDGEAGTEEETSGDDLAIADHLFATLRGTDNLIFANSRQKVEIYADLLKRRCDLAHVPNEFIPHHGSLSKELREHAESRLKDRDRPVNAVCTSTLEMGIDIGSVTSIAQLGAPRTVAGLRQRLGRSGRRGGASTLRMYITEEQVTPQTPPPDALRADLVQGIAMVNLLLAGWVEAPDSGGLHLSTLTQQLLSLIAQHGGVTPQEAYRTLCQDGPFSRVTPILFKSLLRALADEKVDFIRQERDGLLLHGVAGERVVQHYSFYAAFRSATEFRLIANGRTLGTLPVDYPLMPGSLLIFGGKRWKVTAVDSHARVVELTRSSGGRPPAFSGGGGGEVADEVRREMYRIYTADTVPRYLDATAARLLSEGRANFKRFELGQSPILSWGADILLFPWRGDRILTTLTVALTGAGFDVGQDGVCLTLTGAALEEAARQMAQLVAGGPPDPLALASHVETKIVEKYDEQLSDELLEAAFAARSLDVEGAWKAASGLRDSLETAAGTRATADERLPGDPGITEVVPRRSTRTQRTSRMPELGSTPFAVLDVETTGFSPRLHDRVVEVAVVRTAADGTVERSWTTLLNPERDLGPTHVHGIRGADVRDAPRFADIAGDLAELLADAVVVAHNARFDLGFITAEYVRIGGSPPTWPAICTLAMSHRLGLLGGGRLTDCLAAEGLAHDQAHSALGDASATAGLLATYLRRSSGQGISTLGDLGCVPTTWPENTDWFVWPPSGRSHGRSQRWRPELSPLAQLVRHLPAHDLRDALVPADTAAYLDLLDRALEDRRIDDRETAALAMTAQEWGLSRRDVHQAHSKYLSALAATALADGVLTDFEATDLADVAAALGFGVGEVAAALHDARSHQPETAANKGLRGLGVCFTGALQARLEGELITRDRAQSLARAAGLVVHERVTKGLDLLIVADPESMSGKANKARTYGTRIMAEATFWKEIGLAPS